MSQLHATIGAGGCATLCDAFASAQRSIVAQFHSVGDLSTGTRARSGPIIDALNAAARRGINVTVHVEADRCRYDHHGVHEPDNKHVRRTYAGYERGFDDRIHVIADADPQILEHAKAAVVDGSRAFVATANPNRSGYEEPGAIVVEDDEPSDVSAIGSSIDGTPSQTTRVVSGPTQSARDRIAGLLSERHDERIAIEDLSDSTIVQILIARSRDGFHDEVIVKSEPGLTLSASRQLIDAGIAVRALPGSYLHDKYIDAGDRIYIGSANLTRNGLDEAREIGVIAKASDFDDGAASLRADFDAMWHRATAL